MPLRVGGTVIGTLQIYAAEPGAFDPGAVRLLLDLADDLGYGIGRIRDRAALKASEERFRVLADAAPVGILETRPAGGIATPTPGWRRSRGRTSSP